MAGTTPRGLHRPVGADPVEPATGTTPEKNAKPTDVALLADSADQALDDLAADVETLLAAAFVLYENDRPKATVAAGATGTLSSVNPPFGTITQTVPGFYSLASSDKRLTVTDAGLYLVSVTVEMTNPNSCSLARSAPFAVLDSMPAGTGTFTKTLGFMGRIDAGGYLTIGQTYAGGGSCQILEASIARIDW